LIKDNQNSHNKIIHDSNEKWQGLSTKNEKIVLIKKKLRNLRKSKKIISLSPD